MPVKRYVSASEGAKIACEGAAIYARFMNTPQATETAAYLKWHEWKQRHEDYVVLAVHTQEYAFNSALAAMHL